MATLGRHRPQDNADQPEGGGWPRVVSLVVTATAVTLTAIFTHSPDLATLVAALVHHPR